MILRSLFIKVKCKRFIEEIVFTILTSVYLSTIIIIHIITTLGAMANARLRCKRFESATGQMFAFSVNIYSGLLCDILSVESRLCIKKEKENVTFLSLTLFSRNYFSSITQSSKV